MEFEVSIIYTANDQEHAEDLFDSMLEGIGCSEECKEAPCPHFLAGFGPHELKDEDSD